MPCRISHRPYSMNSVWLYSFIWINTVYVKSTIAWSTTFTGVSSRRSRCTLVIVHSSINNEHEDDSPQVQSPAELRQALYEMSRLSNTSTQSLSNGDYSSIPNLENLTLDSSSTVSNESPNRITQDYPEYPGRVTDDINSNMNENEEQLGPTADGWFLDESAYANSRSHMNPDGSLNLEGGADSTEMMDITADSEYQKVTENLLRMASPNVPASFLSNREEEEPTLESLLQQTPPDPSATSEELHKQVFKQEEGFLKQSKIFLESLGTDGSKAAAEAARLRRGAEYRKRQEEAISKLYKEIDDFEAHLNDDISKPVEERCFKCGCPLSPQELEQFRSRQLPASRRLCSVCYGDLLVAKSDKSFFRDDIVIPRSKNVPYRPRQRPVNTKTPTPRRRDFQRLSAPTRRQTISPPPQPSTLRRKPPVLEVKPRSPERRADITVSNDDKDDIELLKREVKELKDELHNMKDYNEDDDIDNGSSQNGEDSSGHWSQVIDPDTGEVFFWNDETEEIKWEL